MKKRIYLPGLILGCLMLMAVVSRAASVPVTTGNLANDTVCTGATATFIFTASDTSAIPAAITYTWQVSTNGGSTWSSLVSGGAYTIMSDTLVIVTNVSLNGYKFRSIATNTSGSDTSFAARLKVDSTYYGSISGPASVCVGAQITWASTMPGGAWSATNDSATISSTGVITGMLSNGATAGNDTIFYYITNSCGYAVDTAQIMIQPAPAAPTISGPSAVCRTGTITLTGSIPGGIWSRLHPSVDSVSATGVVTGLALGTDTVKYTTSNGVCSVSGLHPVRVDTTATAMPITGPTVTCQYYYINLFNGNTAGSWVWSASNSHASVSTSGLVWGLTGGMDTITYTFTNACNTVLSTAAVRIDTLLNPGVISGLSAVCAGSWIHLTETLGTGVWISSNSSLAVVDPSGNVTGVAQGSPVISYVVSNGCGNVAATHVVNVNRSASIISGPDSVGIGATVTETDSTTGGTWSVADTTIAHINASTGVVTGIGTGSDVVTYYVSNSCGTSFKVKTIQVGPAPYLSVIAGPDSVCVNGTGIMTDSVSGGTWTCNPDTIATISSTGLVSGVAYGQAIVTYSVTDSFGTRIKLKSVFVNQKPTVSVNGPTIVSLGGNYFLFGYPLGGTWTASNNKMGSLVSTDVLNDTVIITSNDTIHHTSVTYGSFVVTSAGKDTLTYTVTNSCGSTSKTFVMSLSNAGTPIVNGNSEVLSVFPNPANGTFTVFLAAATDEHAKLMITNVVGEKIKELDITTNRNVEISLDQLAGIYLVTAVSAEGNKYNTKVVISK